MGQGMSKYAARVRLAIECCLAPHCLSRSVIKACDASTLPECGRPSGGMALHRYALTHMCCKPGQVSSSQYPVFFNKQTQLKHHGPQPARLHLLLGCGPLNQVCGPVNSCCVCAASSHQRA